MTLLVLRPEPGAQATVDRAAERGLHAIAAPLFTIVPCAWEPPAAASHDALVLTSANAARHGGPAIERYRGLPLYVVGAATAAAASAAGLTVSQAGVGDAAALAAMLAADGRRRPLHLAGADHRPLAVPGAEVATRIVYRAEAVAVLPPAAHAALREGAVALLHSPAAAALFARLVGIAAIDRGDVAVAAISPAAAAAAGSGWRACTVAAVPGDAALLAAAARLCEEAATGGAT